MSGVVDDIQPSASFMIAPGQREAEKQAQKEEPSVAPTFTMWPCMSRLCYTPLTSPNLPSFHYSSIQLTFVVGAVCVTQSICYVCINWSCITNNVFINYL
jgi:hypothetical protein